jgi:hypothetical protein
VAISTKEKQIGEYVYQYRDMDAHGAGRFLVRLGKIFGASFEGLFKKGLDVEGGAALGSAVRALFDTLTEDEYDYIKGKLLGQLEVRLEKGFVPLAGIFGIHFADKLEEMFDVLWFALETQYGPFLRAKTGKLRERLAGLGMPLSFPAKSSGQSGASLSNESPR